jgi:hypothetical protein
MSSYLAQFKDPCRTGSPARRQQDNAFEVSGQKQVELSVSISIEFHATEKCVTKEWKLKKRQRSMS